MKRKPGRPPGTGSKQKAAQLAEAQGKTIQVEKRPVGRPRKTQETSAVRVDMGKPVCSYLYFLKISTDIQY